MLKLEIGLLVSGLIAASLVFGSLYWWAVLPESTRAFFKPGNTGALLAGLAMLAGCIGLILLPINIVVKHRSWLWWRVCLAILLLLSFIAVAARI